MRQWKAFIYKWRFLFGICFLTYLFIVYSPIHDLKVEEAVQLDEGSDTGIDGIVVRGERVDKEKKAKEQLEQVQPKKEEPFVVEFKPVGKEPFFVEELLTDFGISLKEKMTCKADINAPKKTIVSINAGHGNENLGGCPDWNCELTYDRSKLPTADAVLIAHDDGSFVQRPDQYVIYFSQESPKNSGFSPRNGLVLNMTLGFRHDSATASPYGYTVKLAEKSRRKGAVVDVEVLKKKTKGAAWFVSHCGTNSQREKIVADLQKDFQVDIYGACGNLKCQRGGSCEKMLDTDYFFYVTFENSICKDYITEKLWSQGYQNDIVPLVLKRSLVEPFVPPKSFIAVDDFKSTQDLAAYLHYLMKNITAYEEYFAWRRDYKVVFLNGANHDVLERPWGFCQICRLMWESPKKHYSINDFNDYWTKSCESDGELARKILGASQKKKDTEKESEVFNKFLNAPGDQMTLR